MSIQTNSKFTTEETKRLGARLVAKQKNAKSRGIDCSLTMEDMFMLGNKLLGHGKCDYTDLAFSTVVAGPSGNPEHPKYPSLERIDDSVGYIRGNVCVVMQRANQLKDKLVDKQTAFTTIDPIDRELMKAMMLFMSKPHMESLKTKYIPNQQPEENTVENEMVIDGGNISVSQEGDTDEVLVKTENPPKVVDIPEDVSVATAYAKYCTEFANVGMVVSVTFAQFKAKYTRKVCALSGVALDKEPKYILILDLQIGFAKDNFLVVDKKISDAVTSMMIATGMSVPKIAAMFNKAVK